MGRKNCLKAIVGCVSLKLQVIVTGFECIYAVQLLIVPDFFAISQKLRSTQYSGSINYRKALQMLKNHKYALADICKRGYLAILVDRCNQPTYRLLHLLKVTLTENYWECHYWILPKYKSCTQDFFKYHLSFANTWL